VETGLKPAAPAPITLPNFTLADLKAAIPKHCFEKSNFTSMRYVFQDLTMAYILYYASTFIDGIGAHYSFAPYVLWPMYWWWQGAVLTGIWVIAHECGHRAFSNSIFFGDCVGMVLHSCLLVPYHPWRISHSKHHQNTNSLEKDEVFVPYTRAEMGDAEEVHDDEIPGPLTFVYRIGAIAKMLLFGWPAYLFGHITGRRYEEPTNHFNPSAPLFTAKDRNDVIASDMCLVAVVAALSFAGYTHGFEWLFKVYVVPYLIVNMWLVMITDLQHTDPRLPHYRAESYTWLKGALCTMDRDYGVMNHLHHHIADTHVCHHLFSYMPHYHAEEASEAIKPLLGDYYLVDDVSPGLLGICEALYKTATHCKFVEDTGNVLWWNRYLDPEKSKSK
jgi:omega-6 fatty acid desaturase (delta-12 desaturase)